MRSLTTLSTVILVVSLALSASGDWDPPDPFKWVQMPDVDTDLGLDVNCTAPAILADDFLAHPDAVHHQLH